MADICRPQVKLHAGQVDPRFGSGRFTKFTNIVGSSGVRTCMVLCACSLRSADSPDEAVRRLDDLVRRQKQFGDLLLSSDIRQIPICGMSFGSVDLPRQTASSTDHEFVSVNPWRSVSAQ